MRLCVHVGRRTFCSQLTRATAKDGACVCAGHEHAKNSSVAGERMVRKLKRDAHQLRKSAWCARACVHLSRWHEFAVSRCSDDTRKQGRKQRRKATLGDALSTDETRRNRITNSVSSQNRDARAGGNSVKDCYKGGREHKHSRSFFARF